MLTDEDRQALGNEGVKYANRQGFDEITFDRRAFRDIQSHKLPAAVVQALQDQGVDAPLVEEINRSSLGTIEAIARATIVASFDYASGRNSYDGFTDDDEETRARRKVTRAEVLVRRLIVKHRLSLDDLESLPEYNAVIERLDELGSRLSDLSKPTADAIADSMAAA